ncbi:MAG: hypothetical protein ACR2NA_14465 [Solirubrobacterales bacterium]
MNASTNAHHIRRIVAGMCMVAAPLALLAGMVIHPAVETSERSIIAAAAADSDAWYASHLLLLISLVLVVPAILGLTHMLREREVVLGHLGGGLALLGVMAFVGIVTVEGVVGWQAGLGDRAEMVALFERFGEATGYVIPFVLVSLGFAVGMITLAYGLFRANMVAPVLAVGLAVGSVLLAVGMFTAAEFIAIAGAAVLLIALSSVGIMVLAESDEQWAHPPTYTSTRPITGM